MRAYVLVGKSSRLRGKHLIDVIPGKRLIDIVVENIRAMGLEPVIYSKIPLEIDAPVIRDSSPWILPAIISLLEKDDGFFVFGGDMPLIRREAVEAMLSRFSPGKTIVPKWRETGYLEPLHAIYSRNSLSCLENARSLTSGLKNCPTVEFVPADEFPRETFFNVNTADDLEKLRGLLRVATFAKDK